jgi:hypothetical protein
MWVTCAALLAAVPGRTQMPEPTAVTVNPAAQRYGEVGWSELDFSAHKFFLGARTTIRAERASAETLASALRTPPTGEAIAVPAAGTVALRVSTDLPFGREESVTILVDPTDGAALGGEKLMLGGNPYHKFIRYTDGGLFTWRSSPQNSREAPQPPEAWTHAKQYLVEPAIGPPRGMPVTDPYALIYLATAAHLDRRGSQLQVAMLADDQFVEVTFAAGDLTYRRVDFQEVWPGGSRARNGDALVRAVRVTARPVGQAETTADVDLGFLGMRGALTIYVELGSALPVALTGRVHHIGEVTVRLDKALLAAAPVASPET